MSDTIEPTVPTDSTGTTDTETDTETDTAAPWCGDGNVDRGEECDDGNDEDDDECTSECKKAECGDGHVWSGMEQCDDGNSDDDDGCPSTCEDAICGDGFVWDGMEDCDDANMIETDDCLSTCENASCGDGHVWAGTEDCDPDRAGVDDAGCDADCSFPECGDGYVNFKAGEECDIPEEDDPLDVCSTDCSENKRIVFVTSVQVRGDMSTADVNDVEPGGTGVDKADGWCQQLAEAAGLPGIYRAWLSVPGSGPATAGLDGRFLNTGVNAQTVPYVDVSGVQIAASWEKLIEGNCDMMNDCLDSGIILDENVVNPDNDNVWTNTTVAGLPSNMMIPWHCDSWTYVENDGTFGRAGSSGTTNSMWTETGPIGCGISARIYCFKQAPPP